MRLVLNNGLTVEHLHVPGAKAGHFGLAVRAGSSDETSQNEFGLAHFVEHTLFKGTLRRNSWHIVNRMESVGGELNAFTTKVDTVIYTSFPKGAVVRAVELLIDLILNSQFPEREIDKEREVICDEINSYLDSPSDAVYDDFEDLLYENTPLGHNILGTIESVRNINSEMCRNWVSTHYHCSNMVAFYAGSLSAESFLKKTRNFLELIPAGTSIIQIKSADYPYSHFIQEKRAETHQAHTVMGTALPNLTLDERMAVVLLTNILGGPGMNSIFNLELRERRGLVYNVESSLSNWRGNSMFTTYFGCDSADNSKCSDIIVNTINRIANGSITARKLLQAKKQYHGQLILSRENIENRITGIARALLLQGYVLTLEETETLLDKVTCDDIEKMASRLSDLSRLTLQP